MNSLLLSALWSWFVKWASDWLDGAQQHGTTQTVHQVHPTVLHKPKHSPKYPNSTAPGTYNREEGRWNS